MFLNRGESKKIYLEKENTKMENETKIVKKENRAIKFVKDHKVGFIIGATCVVAGAIGGYIFCRASHEESEPSGKAVENIDKFINGLEYDANEAQYQAVLNGPVNETLVEGAEMAMEKVAEVMSEATAE